MTTRADKNGAIIAAAREVFLALGYSATSMSRIAARARVSKQTIYNYFGSKDALFGRIVRERCQQLLEVMRPNTGVAEHPEDALTRLAHDFVDNMLTPEALAFYRTLVTDSQRSPELRSIYYRAGPEFAVATLATYLEQQTRRGVLSVGEPQVAAEQFFSMLGGHLRVRSLLGLAPSPSHEVMTAYVDNAVMLFLNGVRRK